jgi:hypothetical protein
MYHALVKNAPTTIATIQVFNWPLRLLNPKLTKMGSPIKKNLYQKNTPLNSFSGVRNLLNVYVSVHND